MLIYISCNALHLFIDPDTHELYRVKNTMCLEGV